MTLTIQLVRVAAANDQEGRLVFSKAGSSLSLCGLVEWHGAGSGGWLLETGFGALDGPDHPVFDNAGAAQAWFAARIGDQAVLTA